MTEPATVDEVRRAADAAAIHALLTECGQDMKERLGLGTWAPYRPLAVVEQRVAAGEVYELTERDEAVATFTAADEAPPWYELDWFSDPEAPALYLSAVGVRPDRQGAGLGKRCVEVAEDLARARRCSAVRLDTAGENEPAQVFFRRCGYEQRSPVLDYGRFSIVYFEKVLDAGERDGR